MKAKPFKQATSNCGYHYVNNTEQNIVVMKFVPSFIEKVKLVFGSPVWVAAPIILNDPKQKRFIVKVTNKAFNKKQ